MPELSPGQPVGYIVGAVSLEDDSREAEFFRVFGDLDSCVAERRRTYPTRNDWTFNDYELRWPSALSDGKRRWYVAIAERKTGRLEVAHHEFRTTVAEVTQDIDHLRQTYPEYSASVARFLVCEIHEVTA